MMNDKTSRMICRSAVAAIGFFFTLAAADPANGADGTVRVGKGSYTLTPPAGMKLPPQTIFRTARVVGPMPTNDWWSSLAWEPFSSNQFPHPLGVCAAKEGLRVSYPGAAIHAVPKHVMASMQKDLVLGHSQCEEFPDARVDAFSDWFVCAMFARGDRQMRVSYGHGSPFVYAKFTGGGATVRFDAPAQLWSGSADTPVLGVTVKGRHYGLFGPAGSTWSGLDGRLWTNRPNGKAHFSLALLPDDRPETLALFGRYAHAHVVDTRVRWRYTAAEGLLETVFRFQTEPQEGTERGTLFALYPHQWMTTSTDLLPYRYKSVRGPMRLGAGAGFTTVMRFPGVLPALPDKGSYDRNRLRRYVEEAAQTPFRRAGDTYWAGKSLGEMVNLIPVAEQLAGHEIAEKLRNTLKTRLEAWFTAPEDRAKREHFFYYDRNWGTLIGQRPSYGSSEQLNDHHFHYGYFVRAAAEIARADKAWAADRQWGGMVKLLIRDMADPYRDDPRFPWLPRFDPFDRRFPWLRCFDPYAGHSWASGHARFGDGNNQESSSEAMNAWTGVTLWGEATGDTALRDLGIYLYTTEMYAANAYWFDVEDRLFPPGYQQTCAALIWGGKTDYATWFSGEPEHTHGIILLPIQSGSLYLGLYPEYVRRNLQGLAKLRGGTTWKHWHETLWAYEALGDADAAMRRFEADPARIGTRVRPFVYHWIGNLQAMGHVDRQVTADHPTAVAFTRDGKRTYVAYNLTPRPITVRFSDGATLPVPPGQSATKP